MRISDWSSDVCSSDLRIADIGRVAEDQVERPDDPLAPVPQAKGGATGHLQRLGIASRIAERILARIDADPARPRPFGERGEQQRPRPGAERSEEHTSELQSLMRISYAVFCLKKKT